jgi:O-antigen/teichoic acid export membrane protein
VEQQTLASPARPLSPSYARILAQLAWRTAPRLVTTSTLLLGARLLGAGAGFAIQLLLARNLSAGELGVYFTATSLVVVGGILAAHGYPSIATRFVSRYRRPSAAMYLGAFVRYAQSQALRLALILAALVALAGVIWPGLDSSARAAVVLSGVTIPFVAGFRLYGSLATATRSFWLAYLPDVCLKPVVVLAGIGGLLLAGGGVFDCAGDGHRRRRDDHLVARAAAPAAAIFSAANSPGRNRAPGRGR